jgi:hypothetical protein
MSASENNPLGLQSEILQAGIKPSQSGLPTFMNQQAPTAGGQETISVLPGPLLNEPLENIEACRICPRADYGNLMVHISLPTSSILATMGA